MFFGVLFCVCYFVCAVRCVLFGVCAVLSGRVAKLIGRQEMRCNPRGKSRRVWYVQDDKSSSLCGGSCGGKGNDSSADGVRQLPDINGQGWCR
jgi:hypothetical protein